MIEPSRQGRWAAGLLVVSLAAGCGVKAHFPAGVKGGSGGSSPDPGSAGGAPGAGGGGPSAGGAGGAPSDSSVPQAGSGGGSVADSGPLGSSPDGAMVVAPPPGSDAAGPPNTSVGVTIGGKFVPKEKVIVFLHVGHSDMAGRADKPPELRPFAYDTNPQLWMYAKGGIFRPAKEPTAPDDGTGSKSGPGMAILRTALSRAPNIYAISIGHGHSGAQGGWCSNFRKGKVLWPTFMDAAVELKGKVTFGALFTMFGITEYHEGLTTGPPAVGDCIIGLANEVRAELGVPDMPLMVGDWNAGGTGMYDPNSVPGKLARPALKMVPDRDKRAGLIPTDGLPMQDDRHLDMAGQKMWAERAFTIMADHGFIPWAMP
jgi:hypothetical protein